MRRFLPRTSPRTHDPLDRGAAPLRRLIVDAIVVSVVGIVGAGLGSCGRATVLPLDSPTAQTEPPRVDEPAIGNGGDDTSTHDPAGPTLDGGGGGDADDGSDGDAGSPPVPGLSPYTACFAEITSATGVAPNYDQFQPVIGSHCAGTNHQDIRGIERVVFLGDSVTVGTPPTPADETYRSRLSAQLAAHFGLEPPSSLWQRFDLFEGTALVERSGDFWSCARWGARNHDLLSHANQIAACFPSSERDKKTLVIMTMGGNDIARFTKMGLEGTPLPEITAYVSEAATFFEEAVRFLKDPAEFPAGNAVVFANPPEFTDGTGDVASCPAASAGGFGSNWEDPVAQASLVVFLLETYMRVAVETGSDLVFFLESFCGHGYHHDDPAATCYRGPDAERWFDLTCTHPNPIGHGELARLFLSVVTE
jgi:lysophospholipase L1-like esterase